MSDQIQGWLTPEVATAMRELVLREKPSVIVEIGVFYGKSLINAALALKENRHGVIYGIDPWNLGYAMREMGTGENPGFWSKIDLDDVHNQCMHAIWNNQLDEYAVIIRAPSQYTHQLFWPSSIDILYIDGAHSVDASTRDVSNYVHSVRRGGYVWLDDTDWISVQKADEMILKTCRLEKDFGNACLYQKA